jgi:Uma2 family endonuclease
MATFEQVQSTPEDLLLIDDRPMPELVDGELLEREMGQEADSIAATCLILIGMFVREHRLGVINGAQGSYQIFSDQPKKVRIPDVSFTRRGRLPEGRPAQGHSKVAPDLVVEVVSPNDTAQSINKKIHDFLAAGVSLIWVVDPTTRSVMVLRQDGSARRIQDGDILEGEDVIPGFQVPVTALFE